MHGYEVDGVRQARSEITNIPKIVETALQGLELEIRQIPSKMKRTVPRLGESPLQALLLIARHWGCSPLDVARWPAPVFVEALCILADEEPSVEAKQSIGFVQQQP